MRAINGFDLLRASLLCLFVTSAALSAEPVPSGGAPDRIASRAGAPTVPADSPLIKPLELARECQKTIDAVPTYEALFSKKEVVRGKMYPHRMQMKFRNEPFSVYLRFVGAHEGRQVIYVEGQNSGNMLVKEPGALGLLGGISIAPTSSQAMSESEFPITSIGMSIMIARIIEQWEREAQHGEVEVKYYAQAKLGETQCLAIETTHPQPRRHFKYHKTRLYIDKDTNYPVRVEQFGFPTSPGQQPPLMAEYTYSNIKTQADLTARDFDPKNPQYGF